MFEIDECVPTLYAILIFSVLILLSATGSAEAETLYFAGGAAGQPAVNLQQGTVPFTNLGAGLAACFDPKPHFNPNGKTSMNMYVAEQSIVTEIDKTMHWSRDFDLSVDVPTIFNGKASFSDSIQNITNSNFSETSVVLVVDVNAATGFDTPETWVMGDNGKDNLKTGNSTFLRHCGVLIATQVDRSAHFYIVITIHTTSNFVKQDILTKFKYDGSLKVYDVVGGGNTTAGDFDSVISQTNGVVSANLQVAATSEKAMAGLGDLVQNLNGLADVKSHPIGSALNAAGAFLKSHADDKGAIDIVHLLPINFIVPSIPYDKHLSERLDYARTLKAVRTSFEAIAAISDPTGGMLRLAGDATVFDRSKRPSCRA